MKKAVKIILFTVIVIAAASWLTTTAYGHTNNSAALNAADIPGLEITAAPPPAAPSASFYGNDIGSIAPADLFYISAGNVTADLSFTLYLTNTDGLVHYLRYLNLEITVYRETAPGVWEPVVPENSLSNPLLTLQNGAVTFSLPGAADYKVAIGRGCFKTHPAGNGGQRPAPAFYLEAAIM